MISIILIESQNPGNIGAVARVMKNFDFKELIIINPTCNPLSKEARNRAKFANEILKKAKIVKSFSYLNKFDYIIGTTARLGTDYNIPRVPITPEQLAGKVLEISRKTKIALVLGRETVGLKNEEIAKCDFIVTIPTSKKYPVMNISHALSVLLYELYKKSGENKITDFAAPISANEKKQIMKMINQILKNKEFATEYKRETQRKVWKRIIGKSFMTRREAYALMGFLRKIK